MSISATLLGHHHAALGGLCKHKFCTKGNQVNKDYGIAYFLVEGGDLLSFSITAISEV
jgi:hypothetical protein